jgi:hypothetical protein
LTSPELPERLSGSGTVLRGSLPVMTVEYDLTIATPADRQEPLDEPPGRLEITGRLIAPLYTAEPLAGEDHTLVLEDGRRFEFRVIQPDTNEIVSVGALRAAERFEPAR